VRTVSIPTWANVRTEYQAAVLRGAAHPQAAEAWVLFLISAPGRDVLRRHGFIVE